MLLISPSRRLPQDVVIVASVLLESLERPFVGEQRDGARIFDVQSELTSSGHKLSGLCEMDWIEASVQWCVKMRRLEKLLLLCRASEEIKSAVMSGSPPSIACLPHAVVDQCDGAVSLQTKLLCRRWWT